MPHNDGTMLEPPHGKAAGHVHVAPHVEVATAAKMPPAVKRRGPGRPFKAGDALQLAAASSGGRARHSRSTLALATVGTGILDAPGFKPYRKRAASLRRAICAEIADAAGGQCGPAPSALVAAAAATFAAARFAYDEAARTLDTAGFALAAKLDAAARQNVLAAWEIAVREARILRLDGGDPVDVDAAMKRAEERARRGVVEQPGE